MTQKIYLLTIEYDCGEGSMFEILKAYDTEEKAKEALKEQIEYEKENTWINEYNNDDLDEEVSERGYYVNYNDNEYYTQLDIQEVDFEYSE